MIQCACGCGILRPEKDNRGRQRTYIHGHQIGYKGRKWKTNLGYIKTFVDNHPFGDNRGYVLEHRLVMEKHLGRYLEPNEVVHHKNDIRTDNRIENLEVVTKAEHNRIHKTKHYSE